VRTAPVLDEPLADSLYYIHEARAISDGALLRGDPFYRAPLYAYALAPFYALLERPETLVAAAQLAGGCLVLGLVGWLSGRLYGAAAGWTALILIGLYGPLAAQETKILPAAPGILLGTVAMVLLLRAGRPRGFALAGLVLGLGALARPPLLALGLLLAAGWAVSPSVDRPRTRAAALLAGLLIGIAPATLHNFLAGELVPIAANGGMTFFHGNHRENHDGLLEPSARAGFAGNAVGQAGADRRRASELAGRPLTAGEASAFWLREGLRDLASDPARGARLWGEKLRRSLGAHEYADNYSFAVERDRVPPLRRLAVPFPLLWIPAAAALILRSPRRKEDRVLLLFAALGIATCVVFYVGSRYRCESAPALAILAGSAVPAWRAASRKRRALAVALLPLALTVALIPAGRAASTQDALAAAQWGGALERQGRAAEARGAYTLASRLDPALAVAWGRRAALTGQLDGEPAALGVLDEGIAKGAGDPLLHAERGTLRLKTGDIEGAESDLRLALSGFPRDPLLTRDLAVCLLVLGRDREADSLLRHPGLERDPTAVAARAVAALRAGETSRAGSLLEQGRALGVADLPPALRFYLESSGRPQP
jgi:4-amino-4-deoxy-L-arabinose transferase-like glycosyltransferase